MNIEPRDTVKLIVYICTCYTNTHTHTHTHTHARARARARAYVCMYVLPHVTVRIGNVLQLTDMLDLEGTETPENSILNFLLHFSYDFLLIYFSK